MASTARLARLEDTTSSSMASEYVAYIKWARTRALVYVASVEDYFAEHVQRLGVPIHVVESKVRAVLERVRN